jgi:hypothetical protein
MNCIESVTNVWYEDDGAVGLLTWLLVITVTDLVQAFNEIMADFTNSLKSLTKVTH